MRLACSAIANEDHRFSTFDIAALRQFLNPTGRDLRRLRKIKRDCQNWGMG